MTNVVNAKREESAHEEDVRKTLGRALAWALLGLLMSTPARGATLNPTDDASVNASQPTQNLGAAQSLFARNVGGGGARDAFVRFDLSPVPSGATVERAILRLFVKRVDDPGTLEVFEVSDPWSEDSLTAGTQPALAATPFESIGVGTADAAGFLLVDVTSTVNDWLDGTKPNHGLALRPAAGDALRIEIDSKEDTSTGHAPELEVFPTVEGGSPSLYLRSEEITTSVRTSVSVECDPGDLAFTWGFSTLSGETSNLVQAFLQPDFAGYSFIVGAGGTAATLQVLCRDVAP